MNQAERIKLMSSKLKSAHATCKSLDIAIMHLADALEQYDREKKNIEELSAYYESSDWKDDFADDENGLIPTNIDRGALSEDGIYSLLEKQKQLQESLQDLKDKL